MFVFNLKEEYSRQQFVTDSAGQCHTMVPVYDGFLRVGAASQIYISPGDVRRRHIDVYLVPADMWPAPELAAGAPENCSKGFNGFPQRHAIKLVHVPATAQNLEQ